MELFVLPFMQALLAGVGSWLSVTLGAGIIFLQRDFSRRTMDIMLGIAGGMMLAAAFWGLLTPAMHLAQDWGKFSFVPLLAGLALGGIFLLAIDLLLPHMHALQNMREGISTHWHKSVLLVIAMALHHIPEGLAMGVSYGAVGSSAASAAPVSMATALMVTFSMMLQNIPEGLIVATALRSEGFSAQKSCYWGMMSGITAPLGAVLGALTADISAQLLPVALAFAAGAMLYVVAEEVLPEANASGNGHAATLACIAGVALVLTLDVLTR